MAIRTPTDRLWAVLPRNATPLERNLLKVAPFDQLLEPAIPGINTAKRTLIPDNWLPWLVVEYGLARLEEFVPDMRQLIEEGLDFNCRIGTPSAIQIMLGWMGMTADLWEEPEPGLHTYEFQLRLTSPPPELVETLCKLGRAMDIAKPARGRFRRIYNDLWNIGRFVLDESDWGDILDNYSGVYGQEIPICGGRQLWISLAVLADNTPTNGPVINQAVVSDFTFAEEMGMSYISLGDWPMLDDDYVEPSSFYPTPQAGLRLAETGPMVSGANEPIVDELGAPIVDESNNPILYAKEFILVDEHGTPIEYQTPYE